ncbi:DUF6602 domain-containing protein [Sorangium sp. So ce388]|uniref:DUF6602 domain-containing protein n=1 Tax=Sorangium sp. So ce388 TaxID=3133309 RepID=UPI003F5BDD20
MRTAQIARTMKGRCHHLYLSRIATALSECQTLATLAHAGEKGRVREVLLRQMFRPLLPADLGVGTGFIVAADGRESTQQDIVLYDRSVLPPALYDQEVGLFPIESVLYTIEVKSVLTRQELLGAHDAAEALAQYPLLGKDAKPISNGPRPISVLFALGSNLSSDGKTEAARYDELRGNGAPRLSAICIAGRGYWWFDKGKFQQWPERHEHSEVVGFLGGIMNALPGLWEARRASRPPLGAYLIDFGNDLVTIAEKDGTVEGRGCACASKWLGPC